MKVENVIENLRKTIAGKELYRDEIIKVAKSGDPDDRFVANTVAEFVKINLNELNAILADLEKVSQWS